MASPSRSSSSPRRQRKLLLARILVALHVQGADLQALQVAQQLLVILQLQRHLRGHLGLARGVPHPGHQHPDGLFDGAALPAQLARTPVESPQAVQNRSPDAELRITAKLHLLGGIELGEGIHQPHHTGRNHILDVHMLGQALVNAAGEKAHDGQVLEQHPLLLAGEHRDRRSGGRIPASSRAPARSPAQDALIPCRGRRFYSHCRPLRRSTDLPAVQIPAGLPPRFPPGPQRTVPTGRRRISGGISPAATTARRGTTGSSQRLT